MSNVHQLPCQAEDHTWTEPRKVSILENSTINPEYLPKVIADLATAASNDSGIAMEAYAMAMLCVCSGVASDRYKIQCRGTGWLERPKIWVSLVAKSGTGKSPVYRLARRPIEEISQALKEENRLALKGYENRLKDFEDWKRMKGADKGQVAKPDPGDPPPVKGLTLDNATLEWQQKLAHDNPRGLFLLKGEMSPLVRSTDPKKIDMVMEYLEAFDGGPRSKGTVKNGQKEIDNWSMGFLTTVQPKVVSQMPDLLRDTGFLQRFIPVPVPEQEWVEENFSYDNQNYHNCVHWLWAADPANEFIFELDDEGKELAKDFLRKIHKVRTGYSANETFTEHVNKYPTFLYRLALTYHLIEIAASERTEHGNEIIPGRIVRQVIGLLSDYCFKAAKSFYLTSVGGDSPQVIADKIIAKLKKEALDGAASITMRELSRGLLKNVSDASASHALGMLEAYGWMKRTRRKVGGAISIAVVINPQVREIAAREAAKDFSSFYDIESVFAPGQETDPF
jgi:hypothetical protein